MPGQLLPLLCELVAAAGQLLLALEQLAAGGKPLLSCCDVVLSHQVCLQCHCGSPLETAEVLELIGVSGHLASPSYCRAGAFW